MYLASPVGFADLGRIRSSPLLAERGGGGGGGVDTCCGGKVIDA